jgi:predicted dehydrogenase
MTQRRLCQVTRRQFLGRTVAGATAAVLAPYFVPAGVLAASGNPAPSDRVGIAYIGVGRRGNQLMGLPPAGRIVAVADVDRTRAEATALARKCRAHADYRELLDARDVDAVIVATPDHWHALPSIQACQAGKDVYCEKPLGLTIREGRLMVQAARKYERVFQTGTQRRSMQNHRLGCELVRNGFVGKIHTVLIMNYPSPWKTRFPGQAVPAGLDWDAWCGQTTPVPFHSDIFIQRSKPGWISLRPYSGGEMTGTGAHGFDQIQWALDRDHTGPVEVWAEGGKLPPVVYEAPESLGRGDRLASEGYRVRMRYADGIEVRLEPGEPAAGAVFIGDRGKVRVGNNEFTTSPAEIASVPQDQWKIRLPVSNDHLANWIDCIKTRQRPIADVEIGHRSAIVCHLGNIVRWVGRKLTWDPQREVFPGDDEANSYLSRPMRAPYQLPDPV